MRDFGRGCKSLENAIDKAIQLIADDKKEEAITTLMGWQFFTTELQRYFQKGKRISTINARSNDEHTGNVANAE